MTPLLEQFIIESRDFLQAIGESLMALEKDPNDEENINELFRRVHTLKGNSGLFDYPAMTHVLHAAEDLMTCVRDGKVALSNDTVDNLLDAMDFVACLIDDLEQTEAIAPERIELSKQLTTALRALIPTDGDPEETDTELTDTAQTTAMDLPSTLMDALHNSELEASTELVLVRYQPIHDCFFKGEDPFFQAKNIPGLVAGYAFSDQDFPSLEEMDCFECRLTFLAISQNDLDSLNDYFRYVPDQVQLTRFSLSDVVSPSQAETAPLGEEDQQWFDDIVAIQKEILGLEYAKPWAVGRIKACANTLAAAFSHLGVNSDIQSALQQAIESKSNAPLLQWLKDIEIKPQTASQTTPSLESDTKPAPAPTANSDNETASDITPTANPVSPTTDLKTTRAPEESLNVKVLKVDKTKVDHLMSLIGEMVVAKNALPYLANRAENQYGVRELARELKAQYAVINRIAEEMQDAIMQVRMMPISFIFQRFPRLVRDISKKLGKQVNLNLKGEDTEADKNIVESLADPLIHIVRNSLDHGLESPEVRRAAGKSEVGQLHITATQESDRVLIEISDDGAGIDPEKIKRKAYAKGIISEEKIESLSDQEAINLVFSAGFSTAEQVSDLSGRGVGMDVVKTAVNKVGGTVMLQSEPGKGTRITLSLPLSMAVTNVMIIESDEQIFGIPMDTVVETVRLPSQQIREIKNQKTCVLRGRVIPLMPLNELLGIDTPPMLNEESEYATLVVKIGSEQVGLLVDRFSEVVDVILKPLPGEMTRLHCYAGSALLGDGSVLMVLNPKELVQ